VPNTTIGGATALTAARTDKIPVDRGGTDGYVTVAGINAADSDYIDIRDFGSVTELGDIGPALQATFTYLNSISGSFTASQRVRVPKVGSGVYTCSAITFPTNAGIILELDCHRITIANTWSLNFGQSIVGLQHDTDVPTHPYGPNPKSYIVGTAGMGPTIEIAEKGNISIEGVTIISPDNVALNVYHSSLITVKNCRISTQGDAGDGDPPAMKFDSTFWAQLDNLWFEAGLNSGASAGYCVEFTTDFNWGTNNGIMLCTHWIVNRNGILFRGDFGPGGVNNTYIEHCHSENMVDGTSLVTFDSTNGLVGNIRLVHLERSDSLGTVYVMKNIGSNTTGIHYDGGNQAALLDPTSDPIHSLVVENTCRLVTSSGAPPSFYKAFAGSEAWRTHTHFLPSSIDTKLICSPVGLPWVPYAPLAVVQNPASWTAVSGATITTGKIAPDGSTMAAQVTGGSGARVYNTNHTLANDDYIVFGCWVRHPTGGSIGASQTGIEILGAGGSPVTVSGSDLFSGLEDGMADNGWRWCSSAAKVVAIGSNPHTVRFRFLAGGGGAVREFFNPCAMLIPASAGYDEVWLMQFARSMKGGFPSDATAGDIAVLDHQKVRLGGGVRIFSSASVPTTGTGEVGDISFNSAPAAGEPLGWVCIGAGSPGSWMGLATITDASMVMSATGTNASTFVGQATTGTVTGALSATGTNATAFIGSHGEGALSLLNNETQGFAIDGTTDGGTVAVIDTGNPSNNLNNANLDSSNLVNASLSPKTVLWGDGLLRTLAVGSIPQQLDTARSLYGILVEPAATNLLIYSQELDDTTGWSQTGASITANAATAPDSTTTADKIVESSGGTVHITQSALTTITASTTYTYSVYLKKAERTANNISLTNSGTTVGIFANVDLTNGLIAGSGAFGGATLTSTSITAIGTDDWYRVTLTGIVGAQTSVRAKIRLENPSLDDEYSGDGTSGIYAWGAQLELGTLATSYIATTAASVTRAADAISVDTDTFPWSDTAGTIYLDYKPFNVASGTRYGWSAYLDANNFISLAGITANPTMGNTTASSADVASDLGTLVANTRTQVTVGFADNDFDGSQDGAALVSDGSATLTINYDPLYIGTTGVTGSELHGYIYRMVFVPRQVETDTADLDTWRYNF
jgi:hypothetical protein